MTTELESKTLVSPKKIRQKYADVINRKKPRLLSAFWGLDNGINGLDGMPITFSWLINSSIDCPQRLQSDP